MSYPAVIVGNITFGEIDDSIKLAILGELNVLSKEDWTFDGASWTIKQFEQSSSLKGCDYEKIYQKHKKHLRDFFISLYILTEAPNEELYYDQGKKMERKLLT
jgi:hypothetical protein